MGTDRRSETGPTPERTDVGSVDAGGGDAVVVSLVARTYQGPRPSPDQRPIDTVTPVAVDVRRVKVRHGQDVGGLTPDNARALADLLHEAADLAEHGEPRARADGAA